MPRTNSLGYIEGPNEEWVGIKGDDPDLKAACKTSEQQTVFELPSKMIKLAPTESTPKGCLLRLTHCVNGLLIQSRGAEVDVMFSCAFCFGEDDRYEVTLFDKCVKLDGHWRGACGNCEANNIGHECGVRDKTEVMERESVEPAGEPLVKGERVG